VLAFPCNQFKQEPGTNTEIKQFAQKKFGVTFPLFSKVEVNGPDQSPIFKFLKTSRPSVASLNVKARDKLADGAADITWNFNKFLVDATGKPIKRYPPPMDDDIFSHIQRDIEGLLSLEHSPSSTLSNVL